MAALVVVLPTPPLPDVTTITSAMALSPCWSPGNRCPCAARHAGRPPVSRAGRTASARRPAAPARRGRSARSPAPRAPRSSRRWRRAPGSKFSAKIRASVSLRRAGDGPAAQRAIDVDVAVGDHLGARIHRARSRSGRRPGPRSAGRRAPAGRPAWSGGALPTGSRRLGGAPRHAGGGGRRSPAAGAAPRPAGGRPRRLLRRRPWRAAAAGRRPSRPCASPACRRWCRSARSRARAGLRPGRRNPPPPARPARSSRPITIGREAQEAGRAAELVAERGHHRLRPRHRADPPRHPRRLPGRGTCPRPLEPAAGQPQSS